MTKTRKNSAKPAHKENTILSDDDLFSSSDDESEGYSQHGQFPEHFSFYDVMMTQCTSLNLFTARRTIVEPATLCEEEGHKKKEWCHHQAVDQQEEAQACNCQDQPRSQESSHRVQGSGHRG